MANIDALLATLNKVKRTGDGRWIACCPAHADKSPSLSIRYTDDRILLYCFGGCAVDAVASAIGLTLADLMPEHIHANGSKPVNSKIPASDLLAFIHFESTIVMVAASDFIAGKALSIADYARLRLAHDRLEGSARECCR